MIERLALETVRHRLRRYPAVALVGPRQAGKTTLAKVLGGAYLDLEQEAHQVRLDVEWPRLIAGNELVIVDEAQSWPDVFPRLRGAIDADRKRNGRFLLLGSVSPSLMVHVSESLAGRLSLVELTPLLSVELPAHSLDETWLHGGYPDGGVLGTDAFPQWQRDYIDLLTFRDLPSWGLTANPQTTQRLLKMLAAAHGQIWNASQIGMSLGVSHPTVNHYLDYLVGAFLIRRLAPFRANIRKRLTKSPKIYWRDSGLLHALMNVTNRDDLLGQPWVGGSWEGFVIEQILGALSTAGRHVEPYFLRTTDQYEIDLLLDFGKELWAIEIKLTSNPTTTEMSRLNKVADLIGATRRILISRTLENIAEGNRVSCSLPWFLDHLSSTHPD